MTRSTGQRRSVSEQKGRAAFNKLPKETQRLVMRRLEERYRSTILTMARAAQQYLTPVESLRLIEKQTQDLIRIAESKPKPRDGGPGASHSIHVVERKAESRDEGSGASQGH